MSRLIFLIFLFILPMIATQLKLDLKNALKNVLNSVETEKFSDYLTKWKKNYQGNETELKRRAKIWKKNKADIDAENAIAKGYTCGENMFTDMDQSERQKYVMDANLADQADAEIDKLATRAKRGAQMTYVGETMDWRHPNLMPAVRNQGSCGSCYAFAAINAIEVQWSWLKNTLYQFSEQQIVDCSGTNNGCNGGWPERVFNYSYYYGNAARASYPYKGVKGTCYNTARTKTVSTWYKLTTVSQMESYNYYYGAVAFSIYVPNSIYSYTGGIFYPTQTTCSSTNNVGAHAMTIVGYGAQNGVPYWIVRNSWGASWGEGGYFRMRKGVNNCGMESRGVYFPWLIGQSG